MGCERSCPSQGKKRPQIHQCYPSCSIVSGTPSGTHILGSSTYQTLNNIKGIFFSSHFSCQSQHSTMTAQNVRNHCHPRPNGGYAPCVSSTESYTRITQGQRRNTNYNFRKNLKFSPFFRSRKMVVKIPCARNAKSDDGSNQ